MYIICKLEYYVKKKEKKKTEKKKKKKFQASAFVTHAIKTIKNTCQFEN